jgi:putative ABC transport system permease protein
VTGPWRKVVRDAWRERSRAGLVVLAIAIGLTGFLAVISTYTILDRELTREYLATNPASAVLLTDGIDEELLAAVIARDDIDTADARRALWARMQRPDGSWRPLRLFALRDFPGQRLNTITSDHGAWPPAAGELLIERDAFQVAKAQVGDAVTVELKDLPARVLRISGGVHDAGQAQARMEDMVYAYTVPETLTMLGESAALDRLSVQVAGDRSDKAHITRVAADLKTWLESRGHAVRYVDVPPPLEHPHAMIMGLLLLAMAAFGLVALALGGVIAANLLLAMIASERRQIGVMKAIGASRRQIAAIYLAEAALFGVAAIVVALVPGLAVGRELSRYFAVLLNIDLASMAIPVWAYALTGLVGLLVPLVAAAYPVRAAVAMTVRESISASGVDGARVGTGLLDRLLRGAGGRPWLLGVRNSLRRPTRTALTVVTLAVAGTFFITALNVRLSMMTTIERLFNEGAFGASTRYAIDQHFLMLYAFFLLMAAVLGVVGGLGLMTSTSLNVLERRRELGVLRAIGATPVAIGTIVIAEAVFVAVTAWVAALIAGWGLTIGLDRLLSTIFFPDGLDVAIAPLGIAGWLALSTLLAVVSSIVPAITASRKSIREAVSYE